MYIDDTTCIDFKYEYLKSNVIVLASKWNEYVSRLDA